MMCQCRFISCNKCTTLEEDIDNVGGCACVEARVLVWVQSLSHVWLFFDPMDCSPLVSCIHGISHARILEWVAIFYSKGSSWPRDGTVSLAYPALAGGFFTTERPGKGCYTQCCPLIPRHLLKKERKKERKYMSTEILVYECSLQHRNLNINVLICSL